MNLSHENSLKDYIRISNSNIEDIPIITYENLLYVSKDNIDKFMNDNGINLESTNTLYDILKDKYNKEINIVTENEINAFEVANVAKGRSIFSEYINKFGCMVSGNEYNEEREIKKYIKKCDEALSDIRKEKKKVKNASSISPNISFSTYFLFRCSRKLLLSFAMPTFLSSSITTLPIAITKVFAFNSSQELAKALIDKTDINKTIAKNSDITLYPSSDIKGLYLSVFDYNGLLEEYENQIEKVKRDLNVKLIKLKRR